MQCRWRPQPPPPPARSHARRSMKISNSHPVEETPCILGRGQTQLAACISGLGSSVWPSRGRSAMDVFDQAIFLPLQLEHSKICLAGPARSLVHGQAELAKQRRRHLQGFVDATRCLLLQVLTAICISRSLLNFCQGEIKIEAQNLNKPLGAVPARTDHQCSLVESVKVSHVRPPRPQCQPVVEGETGLSNAASTLQCPAVQKRSEIRMLAETFPSSCPETSARP